LLFRQLFDRTSCTYTYLLADPATREAILVDPVLELVDRDAQLLIELELRLLHTVETHVHADHVTGASALAQRLGSEPVYPATADVPGARLLAHGERLSFGAYGIEARATPGHTTCSTCYLLPRDLGVLTGDTLLIRGCGRTDFQGGSASTLFRSVHEELFSLPASTAVWPGHDYQGRTQSTIGEEKVYNPRLGGDRTEAEFVALMDALGLPHPKKIDVAVPANRDLGRVAPA
jgi:glyoxylase-like metal-dependent hydrolase (beta-lactamase superfamily II)